MKNIEDLIPDIYSVLSTPTTVSETDAGDLGRSIARIISERLAQSEREPSLRMSNLGSNCERKLYYTVNESGRRAPLAPETRLKFIYGDILEAVLLFLAKSAGHTVEGEQDELEINGVFGHRDAIIDGVTVDVKSASTYSFAKFSRGLTPDTDAFGYLDQLRSYVFCGQSDERVRNPNEGAFLVIDKTLGHLCLDRHTFDTSDVASTVDHKKAVINSDKVPPRAFFDELDGKSGNRKLGTVCSYCDFKKHCWPEARLFLYSTPRWLTKVVKTPDVPEAKVEENVEPN